MSDGGPVREFRFTAEDFERVRRLIHERAGIALSPVKQDMVYSRLARRLRANGDATFAQYLARLEGGDGKEWETFINSLTTNLTSFFREAHHFEILLQQMKGCRSRPFRIWCSAASTGEEPYSLAITACEAFKTLSPPVSIFASDIDTNVLATAGRGVYPEDRVDKMEPERLRQFFQRGAAAQAGYVRIRPDLQKLVTFSRVNLLDVRWPLEGPFDALF